jgi:hypothetical protein
LAFVTPSYRIAPSYVFRKLPFRNQLEKSLSVCPDTIGLIALTGGFHESEERLDVVVIELQRPLELSSGSFAGLRHPEDRGPVKQEQAQCKVHLRSVGEFGRGLFPIGEKFADRRWSRVVASGKGEEELAVWSTQVPLISSRESNRSMPSRDVFRGPGRPRACGYSNGGPSPGGGKYGPRGEPAEYRREFECGWSEGRISTEGIPES